MERIFLKNVIFDAASKAAKDAVIKFITTALTLHRCTQIVASGEVGDGGGFTTIGFSKIKFDFVYYGFRCEFKMSNNGGQFYATVKSAHETIMDGETCQHVDSFIKKLDKILKKK